MREKEIREARKALEKSWSDRLSLADQPQRQPRGHAGKEQNKGTKPEPKKTPKNEKDARGGGNGGTEAEDKLKQQHSSAMKIVN